MKTLFKNIFYLLLFIVAIVGIDVSVNEYLYSSGYGAKTNIGNGKYFQDSALGIYTVGDIRMKAGDSLTYNGVTVTSGTGGGGSGDVTQAGRNTFTDKNVFSDTLKADGLSQLEQVKIADWLNVTGDVTSDLNFIKGSTTRIGTIDANSLQLIKQDTAYITLDNSGISIARNIIPSDTKGLFWSNTSSIASVSGILNYKSSNHNFSTRYSNNVMTVDSGNGMLMYTNQFLFMDTINSWIKNYNAYAMYLGTNSDTALKIDSLNNLRVFENMTVDGTLNVGGTISGVNVTSTGLADLNNVAFNGVITTDMAFEKGDVPNLGTTDNNAMNLITNSVTRVKIGTDSVVVYYPTTFSSVVQFLLTATFNGVATFVVSPVFSALVNFANGLTTTTLTASGNTTLDGFNRIGNLGEYEKTKVIRMYLDSTGLNKVDHGFTGWGFKNILSTTIMVLHDTTAGSGRMLPGGSNLANAISPGVNIWIDSLKINYSLPTTATGLLGDTAYFRIVYTNIY